MKRICTIFLISALFVTTAFAEKMPDTKEIKAGLNTFISDLANSLPDSAIGSGGWSDAYIGKLIPSIPPHFGIGATFGVTTLSCKGLNTAVKEITGNDLFPETFILPTLTAQGRIGGLFLPFDVGFKFMMLNFNLSDFAGLVNDKIKSSNFEYTTYGVDIRYALLQQNIILPNISVGVGYNHINGNVDTKFNTGIVLPPEFATRADPAIAVKFSTDVFDAQVQVSKSFFIVTPYAGLRALLSYTTTEWELTDEKNTVVADNTFSAQVFGGASLNIFVVKLNFGASYNFISNIASGSVGIRVQL